MPNEMNKDDALFQALEKRKKQRRRKILITVLVILVLAAIAIFIAVTTLRSRVRERFADNSQQTLSAQAERGTLSTVVSGSGVLQDVDLESVTVPAGVELLELVVKAQDHVEQGDILATVEASSVLTAMASLQEQLEALDKQIREASSDKVDSYIRSAVAGRVVTVYAEAGETVAQCMMDHGALALISLDGFLAVDISAELEPGSQVTVTLPDGAETTGTVDSLSGGTATLLISDDGPRPGDTAAVTLNGAALGSGELYIHQSLAVTGYAGTIQTVSAKENQRTYRNSVLFTLTDTATTARYDALLRSRSELEQTLLELLTLQRSGGVTAPFAGAVRTLDYNELTAPLAVATLAPGDAMVISLSVDETDILSLELGQTAEVTIPSLGEEPFAGTVTAIDLTSTASGTYSAEISLTKEADMLPGMTADVTVHISGVENTLLIPLEAVQQTRDRTFVYTTYDPETETFGGEKEITLGIRGSTQVEVLSGLEPGDTVWYIKQQTFMDFFSEMTGMDMSGIGGGSGNRPQGGGMPQGGMPQGGQMPGMGN